MSVSPVVDVPANTNICLAEAPSLSYRQLLSGNGNFRWLLSAQFISETGNWLQLIACMGLIRYLSNGDPQATSLLIAIGFAQKVDFVPIYWA